MLLKGSTLMYVLVAVLVVTLIMTAVGTLTVNYKNRTEKLTYDYLHKMAFNDAFYSLVRKRKEGTSWDSRLFLNNDSIVYSERPHGLFTLARCSQPVKGYYKCGLVGSRHVVPNGLVLQVENPNARTVCCGDNEFSGSYYQMKYPLDNSKRSVCDVQSVRPLHRVKKKMEYEVRRSNVVLYDSLISNNVTGLIRLDSDTLEGIDWMGDPLDIEGVSITLSNSLVRGNIRLMGSNVVLKNCILEDILILSGSVDLIGCIGKCHIVYNEACKLESTCLDYPSSILCLNSRNAVSNCQFLGKSKVEGSVVAVKNRSNMNTLKIGEKSSVMGEILGFGSCINQGAVHGVCACHEFQSEIDGSIRSNFLSKATFRNLEHEYGFLSYMIDQDPSLDKVISRWFLKN